MEAEFLRAWAYFYIHQNPDVSGFVYEPEQWIYSSAKGYAKNDGVVRLAGH